MLAKIAIKYGLTRNCINDLLAFGRKFIGEDLPKDSRTLKGTPRSIPVQKKAGGDYLYRGLKKGILDKLKTYKFDGEYITLKLNVDGLPLFKSSSKEFWPILASFARSRPFIVLLWYSDDGKPSSVSEFLEDVLKELEELKQSGIVYNGRHYKVRVGAFIADAPARNFLKCTVGHKGVNACDRCEIIGSSESGRTVFNKDDKYPPRTDEKFNRLDYLKPKRVATDHSSHQTGVTPLIAAGFSCVKGFVLDPMHLIFLGVVKRLLHYLFKGPNCCRLSPQQKEIVNQRLARINGLLPSEFARQPRSLKFLDRYKATEFRQFLLYTGMVVLRGVVPDAVYTHFLTLAIAITILHDVSQERREFFEGYSVKLLEHFVKECKNVYGPTFTSYNVHSLLHICDDVTNFQVSLAELSAFEFENMLFHLKRYVKNAKNPIVQVEKRLIEAENCEYDLFAPRRITKISNDHKDCHFLLGTGDYAKINEIKDDGRLVCDIIPKDVTENFFVEPWPSKDFDIALVTVDMNDSRIKRRVLEEEALFRKCVSLPVAEGFVLIPLLHDVEG